MMEIGILMITKDWGEYNEVIDEVEEQDVFDEMQLSLEGVLAY